MVDLCSTCLCSGRKLVNISDTDLYQVYSQILNEVPVYGAHIAVQLCWECRHVLDKFQRFKDQVKSSYLLLLQSLHQGLQDTKHLVKLPHLQTTHNVISLEYPPIKLEFDSLYLNNDQDGQNFDDNFDQYDQTIGHPLSQLCDRISQAGDADEENNVKEEGCEADAVHDHFVEVKLKKAHKARISKIEMKKAKSKLKKAAPKIKVKKKRKPKRSVKVPSVGPRDIGSDCLDTIVKEDDEKVPIDNIEADDNIDSDKSELQETDDYDELPQISIRNGPVLKAREPRLKVLPNEKPQCAECGKVFSSRKTLRYHLNVLHKGNNRYPCPQCGKVYQWKSNLGRHIRSHKAREKGELYCEMCDKLFASVATYRQHLRVSKQHVSESEFKYTCDECGKKFVSKTRLRDHIDWEHLQKIKFRCQLCNKPFKCHTSLYVHMNNVHRNKGLKDNLCHVCGKSYQNRAKLRYHIVAMHTSETPYQCEQCSAAFGWYSSLYRHVREVHCKMKMHPSKSKRSKKKVDMLPPMVAPHLVLPSVAQAANQPAHL